MPRRLLLDVDAGIDDALAILLALRTPNTKVVGITTVSGNVPVERVTVNVLKTLEAVGADDVPVSVGERRPLLRDPTTAEDFHGRDGLGGARLPEPRLKASARRAVDFIVEEAMSSTRRRGLTLVATGPLTNIAAALLTKPEMAERVNELVIMGGAYGVSSYGCGNVTPAAEFNIYVDPEAARIVLRSGVPLTAVGLDVTQDPSARLTGSLHREIAQIHTSTARFASRITEMPVKRFGGMALHDPLAVAVALDRGLASIKAYSVDVEVRGELTRGQTVADRREGLEKGRGAPNANICVSVDGRRFLDAFLQRVIHR